MVYHINNEYNAGVFYGIASVGGRRGGAGTGDAAGAAFFTHDSIMYMQLLCATFLESKEQAPRAAAVQMRGINEPAGRACSSDLLYLI